jgi:hypothetical protein
MNAVRLSFLAAALALAGCGHDYWVKPGASDQDFHTDLAQCEAAAAQALPYEEGTTQFGNVLARNRASCTQSGVFLTCSGAGPDLAPPTEIPYDANARKRAEMVAACMAGKGWQRSYAAPVGPASAPAATP